MLRRSIGLMGKDSPRRLLPGRTGLQLGASWHGFGGRPTDYPKVATILGRYWDEGEPT